jgi:uncharacterized protein (DUF1778 family)
MAKPNVPTHVTLRLMDFEPHGYSQMHIRTTDMARQDIHKAAKILGLSVAQFMRCILVQAARKVIAEAGK